MGGCAPLLAAFREHRWSGGTRIAPACRWSVLVENGHPSNVHGFIFVRVEAVPEIKYVFINARRKTRMFLT